MAEKVNVGRSVPSLSLVQQMMASGTGAFISTLCVTPLDVVKVRIQAQQVPSQHALAHESVTANSVISPTRRNGRTYCNGLKSHIVGSQNLTSSTRWYNARHFSGTFDGFVKIIRYEGLRGLWSGLSPTLVMTVPSTIVYFGCYEYFRDLTRRSLDFEGKYAPLVCGATARLAAGTVINPLEMIRTKMQSQKLSYKQMAVALRSDLAQDGLVSLWRGWSATALRDIPFSAAYWFNYELVKSYLCQQSGTSQANFTISFTAGAVSGTISAILTMPFDVVKTRRQIQLGDSLTVSAKNSRTSTWHVMKAIWTELGYRGLFAGFIPRVIRIAPACAIMISIYETAKATFLKTNLDRERRMVRLRDQQRHC